MNVITKTVELPDGRTISIETGKLAKQADGAVMLTMGNTMLLATVCAAKDAVPGTDFMPLQVEYREKYAAAGRFPGGFTKREGKASDNEILTCRLVDRALRPLFPSNFHAEVYVNVILYSADGVDMPDALAGFAASAALSVSDIPFEGPISEVRVARINGEYVVDPTFAQLEQADMDIMVGATEENIMMVEGEMKEVSEQDLLTALKVAHEAIKPMCRLQKELEKETGKDVKREYCHEVNDEDLREEVKKACYDAAYRIAAEGNRDKHAREDAFMEIRENFKTAYAEAHADLTAEELEEKNGMIDRYYHDVERDAMRRCVLDEGKRLDGRATTDIRPIWCETSPLPGPHGSAIFTRGETQSLSTCTLGTKLDEKVVDDVLEQGKMRFLLHYNFPPFSTGEAKAQRGVGRREIGHGHLAWRGLKGQIPEDFPYTVRVVSDILESNGSSSMATVCAGTLALMDAGVPMKKTVSGIAMGLIKNPGEEKYAVLSDILGDEDHLGDMDFKTTGTIDGLTATQMDIKCDGLSYEILEKVLDASESRTRIHPGQTHGMHAGSARRTEAARAAHRADHHPERVHRRRHRPGRKDHPGHTGRDRLGHRHRGNRRRGHRAGQRPEQGNHRRRIGQDQSHRGRARSGRGVRRCHPQRDALRRIRGIHAGTRRAAPHLGNRLETAGNRGRSRTEGRRPRESEADGNRREDRQVQALAPRVAGETRRLRGTSRPPRASGTARTPPAQQRQWRTPRINLFHQV